MLEKNDKATNDEYRFRRRAVLNELRKTIKLKPLPHKAPLRARVKRRIKNPKSFWTDFQQIKAESREKKEAKKLAKEAKNKTT